jgi:ABC-type sugar transport system permease subunit
VADRITIRRGGAADEESAAPSRLSLQKRRARQGLFFVSPWIIGFLAFYAVPMVASLWFSFTDFNLVDPEPTHFVGWHNWTHLFRDPLVGDTALVTLKFAALMLPVALFLPLLFAVLLTAKHLIGRSFFRTLFFLPSIIPFVSAIFMFNGVLNGQTGWVNRLLGVIGIDGPEWLNSPFWIYPTLVLIGSWGVGTAMIIFIAGINSVPQELFDAARVDGAGPLQVFRRITWPLISPVTFYNLIIATIGIFQYFLVPYVLKNGTGDPAGQTYFYSMYFYKVAFRFSNMGYGATLAWLLFVAGMIVTGLLFWSAKYWVHYEFEA